MRQRRNIDAKHRERLASQFSGIGHNNIQNWGLPSILRTVELLHLPYTASLRDFVSWRPLLAHRH